MSVGLLFPGQGSQHVGMGRGLAQRFPEARQAFEEADDVLGMALSRIAWEGPVEALTATENAQPALYVHALAVYRVLADRLGPIRVAAGHSLGELSAHGAAGTFAFHDGLRAVHLRGELMAQAGDKAPGGMAALLGLRDEAVEELCRDAAEAGMTLVAANLNARGQVVVSGDLAAIEWIGVAARKKRVKRVKKLAVSAAFHSPLMGPASEEFREHLDGVEFRRPDFPVISNVTACECDGAADTRDLLVRQLTAPVLWVACIRRMIDLGVERCAELAQARS